MKLREVKIAAATTTNSVVTLPLSQTTDEPMAPKASRLKHAITQLSVVFSGMKSRLAGVQVDSRIKKFSWKKIIPVALLTVVVLVVLFQAGRIVKNSDKPADARVDILGARASIAINKDFSFPIKDAKGKALTKLVYTVENAELRDEIIVKGQRAVAVKGRTFLIFNIKIANTFDRGIDVSARDYIRLSKNGNEQELIAADIHNDPVNVQPISTKSTRLGFPINDTDANLSLFVGEIKGSKEKIPLSF